MTLQSSTNTKKYHHTDSHLHVQCNNYAYHKGGHSTTGHNVILGHIAAIGFVIKVVTAGSMCRVIQ